MISTHMHMLFWIPYFFKDTDFYKGSEYMLL